MEEQPGNHVEENQKENIKYSSLRTITPQRTEYIWSVVKTGFLFLGCSSFVSVIVMIIASIVY